MECYVLNVKDLVGCDVVVCLMMIEICEGCGCEGLWGIYFKFKLDYLGKDVFELCLFGIFELLCMFVYVDLVKEFILVILICYYMMGGILIIVDGQCLIVDVDGNDKVVNGLFVCGEIVCVFVYGVNCFGGNFLLDFVVFGCVIGLYFGIMFLEMVLICDVFELDLDVFMMCFNCWENFEKGKGEDFV